MRITFLLFVFIIGCKNAAKKENAKTLAPNIISVNDVLINDKKVLMTLKEFKSFSQIDSTQVKLWECGQPFEWLDKEWMQRKYGKFDDTKGMFKNFDGKIKTLYVSNVEYISNDHLVLFNRASIASNTFKILSKNITVDSNTTIELFEKYFPQAKKESIENRSQCRFRLLLHRKNEDAFIFDFEDGKLKSITLWWLLC